MHYCKKIIATFTSSALLFISLSIEPSYAVLPTRSHQPNSHTISLQSKIETPVFQNASVLALLLRSLQDIFESGAKGDGVYKRGSLWALLVRATNGWPEAQRTLAGHVGDGIERIVWGDREITVRFFDGNKIRYSIDESITELTAVARGDGMSANAPFIRPEAPVEEWDHETLVRFLRAYGMINFGMARSLLPLLRDGERQYQDDAAPKSVQELIDRGFVFSENGSYRPNIWRIRSQIWRVIDEIRSGEILEDFPAGEGPFRSIINPSEFEKEMEPLLSRWSEHSASGRAELKLRQDLSHPMARSKIVEDFGRAFVVERQIMNNYTRVRNALQRLGVRADISVDHLVIHLDGRFRLGFIERIPSSGRSETSLSERRVLHVNLRYLDADYASNPIFMANIFAHLFMHPNSEAELSTDNFLRQFNRSDNRDAHPDVYLEPFPLKKYVTADLGSSFAVALEGVVSHKLAYQIAMELYLTRYEWKQHMDTFFSHFVWGSHDDHVVQAYLLAVFESNPMFDAEDAEYQVVKSNYEEMIPASSKGLVSALGRVYRRSGFHGVASTLEVAENAPEENVHTIAVERLRAAVASLHGLMGIEVSAADQTWIQSMTRVWEKQVTIFLDSGKKRAFDVFRAWYKPPPGKQARLVIPPDINILLPHNYRGGLFMVPGATVDAATGHATDMGLKLLLWGLEMGGAKGGIATDPLQLSDKEIARLLREFVRAMYEDGLPLQDGLGPDRNTSEWVGVLMDEYLRIRTEERSLSNDLFQAHLDRVLLAVRWTEEHNEAPHDFPERTHFYDAYAWMLHQYPELVPEELKFTTAKPPDRGGLPDRPDSTGYGAVHVFQQYHELTSDAPGWKPIDELTAAVQGFGQAGWPAARRLFELGVKIQKITDMKGGLRWIGPADRGLDPVHIRQVLSKIPNHRERWLYRYLDLAGDPLLANDVEIVSEEETQALLTLPVDVLVLAAGPGFLTRRNAEDVEALYVLEIANEAVTHLAAAFLHSRVVVIPDILTNAAGVFVSALETAFNTGVLQKGEHEALDLVKQAARSATQRVFEFAKEKNISLTEAAWVLAVADLLKPRLRRQVTRRPIIGDGLSVVGQYKSRINALKVEYQNLSLQDQEHVSDLLRRRSGDGIVLNRLVANLLNGAPEPAVSVRMQGDDDGYRLLRNQDLRVFTPAAVLQEVALVVDDAVLDNPDDRTYFELLQDVFGAGGIYLFSDWQAHFAVGEGAEPIIGFVLGEDARRTLARLISRDYLRWAEEFEAGSLHRGMVVPFYHLPSDIELLEQLMTSGHNALSQGWQDYLREAIQGEIDERTLVEDGFQYLREDMLAVLDLIINAA